MHMSTGCKEPTWIIRATAALIQILNSLKIHLRWITWMWVRCWQVNKAWLSQPPYKLNGYITKWIQSVFGVGRLTPNHSLRANTKLSKEKIGEWQWWTPLQGDQSLQVDAALELGFLKMLDGQQQQQCWGGVCNTQHPLLYERYSPLGNSGPGDSRASCDWRPDTPENQSATLYAAAAWSTS